MSDIDLPIDSIETAFVDKMSDLYLKDNKADDTLQITESTEIE